MTVASTTSSKQGAINMVQPMNVLSPLNRSLVSMCPCTPGLMGGSRLVSLLRPGDKDGMHGTLTNTPTWRGAMGRPGGYGCVHLAATAHPNAQHVLFPRPAWTSISAFTISYWIWLPGTPAGGENYAGMWDGGSSALQWLNRWASGMDFFVNNAAGSSANANAGSALWTLPGWNYFTMVADGTTLRTYVGETAGGTAALAGPYIPTDTNNQPWALGGKCRNADTSQCAFDDVLFSDVAWSADRVAQRYRESIRGYPTTLNRVRNWTAMQAGAGEEITYELMPQICM